MPSYHLGLGMGIPCFAVFLILSLGSYSVSKTLLQESSLVHITPVLRSLHWLTVSDRIKFKILTLTHKCLYGNDLEELITRHTPSRDGMRSSKKDLLMVPISRNKTMGDRAFSVAAPSYWNELPHELRQIDCFETFKCKLKTHLFDS